MARGLPDWRQFGLLSNALGVPHPADRTGTPTAANLQAAAPAANAPVPIAELAVEIAARAQAGRNRFEIRLDPPELGRIDVGQQFTLDKIKRVVRPQF